jgi:hypothetical protein
MQARAIAAQRKLAIQTWIVPSRLRLLALAADIDVHTCHVNCVSS